MKDYLIDLIDRIESIVDDKYNPDTYFSDEFRNADGMVISHYVLGNAFAKGYLNNSKVNFEIYKGSTSWMIYVWSFSSNKPEKCQFITEHYNYDQVRDYLRTL